MEVFAIIGILCSIPVLVVGGTLWRAYVGTKLWLWFVAPQFHLAPLPIITAIGLSTLIGLYSAWPAVKEDTDEKSPMKRWAASVLRLVLFPALALLTGWVAHQFQ